MKLQADQVVIRRVPRPAACVLAGEERGSADQHHWRVCFFARYAGDPERGIARHRYSFALCRLLEVAGMDRAAAFDQLRTEAAESGYDRVDLFELDPPTGTAEREMLMELRKKLTTDSHGFSRNFKEAHYGQGKTETAQAGRTQRTRDYTETEAPGAIAARIAGGLF